jgi:hypothetical protein
MTQKAPSRRAVGTSARRFRGAQPRARQLHSCQPTDLRGRCANEPQRGVRTCTPNTVAPGCTGTVLCGPRGYDCIRSTGTADTTCNNLDEDCDGLRDDDWTGTTCTPSLPPGVMCQTGFSPQGDQQCSSGSVSCRLRPFCSTDMSGTLRTGSAGSRSCESRQVFCTSAAQCQASERCGPSGSSTCGPGVVGCCASRSCPTCPETWSWCCTNDPNKTNTCYYPTTT